MATVTGDEPAKPTTIWRYLDSEKALLGFEGGDPDIDRGERWSARRAELRTMIAQTRSLLERHSRLIHDPVLTEVFAGRAAEVARPSTRWCPTPPPRPPCPDPTG